MKVKRGVEIQRTPRVVQLESMFDIPPADRVDLEWNVSLPLEEREWNVGLIVGPSGCGKSTVARELFADELVTGFDWDPDRSVLDCFPPGLPIKQVIEICGAVGFNSPPSWLRPFRVLSNGEQFRVTIARALAETDPARALVVDEFTSVVDRQVAKIASHAVQKTIRRRNARFVAVTCHHDIIDWLEPDWVFHPGTGDFHWRHLRGRPRIELQIKPVSKTVWGYFKHHHYMSGTLGVRAQCVGGFIDDECIAFAAWLAFPHPKTRNIMHGHRLVVLPDYQGLGIGGRMDDWIGQHLWDQRKRYRNVVAHPAMIAYYSKSPRWAHCGTMRGGGHYTEKSIFKQRNLNSTQRIVSTFEYRAPGPN